MAFRVNGVNTIITTTGDMGLGTLTPTANISISANTQNALILLTQSGSGPALNVVGGEVVIYSNVRVIGNLISTGGFTQSSGNTFWHSGNDGTGSGLDADLLDGNNSNFFSNSTNQTTGTLPTGRVSGPYTGITGVGTLAGLAATGNVSVATNVLFVDGTGNKVAIGKTQPNSTLDVVGTIDATSDIASATAFRVAANTVWHQGNDGTGSGLDADLLDANDSSFFTNSTNHTTGTLPSGRATGSYTGITLVGTLANIAVTGLTTLSANLAVDTNVLFVDSTGNKVAIGKTQPNSTLDVVGTINATSDIASATAFKVGPYTVWHSGNMDVPGANNVWHSGNDGTGSGLDADLLDANDSSFFTNSTNQTTGTLPSARLSGAYTGISALGTLTDLDVTGNVSIDTSTLFVDSVGNKVSIGGQLLFTAYGTELAPSIVIGQSGFFSSAGGRISTVLQNTEFQRDSFASGINSQFRYSSNTYAQDVYYTGTGAPRANGSALNYHLSYGQNSANTQVEFVRLISASLNISSGMEQGQYTITANSLGNLTQLLTFTGAGPSVSYPTINILNGTRLQTNDGNVTIPGIGFVSDVDTGIYRIGTNQLGFAAGGIHVMNVKSGSVEFTGHANISSNVLTNNLTATGSANIGGALGVAGVATLTSAIMSGNATIGTTTLVVDTAGKRLGINTTPNNQTTVHIVADSSPTGNVSSLFIVGNSQATNNRVIIEMSPTSATGKPDGGFQGGSTFGLGRSALIVAEAEVSSTAVGLSFWTNQGGTTTERMRLNRFGRLSINQPAEWNTAAQLYVGGNVNITTSMNVGTSATFGTALFVGANTVWHLGNDGTGSGLDADLLDANDSSFYTNSTNHTTGTLPTGRVTGAYTGITGVGALASLNVSGAIESITGDTRFIKINESAIGGFRNLLVNPIGLVQQRSDRTTTGNGAIGLFDRWYNQSSLATVCQWVPLTDVQNGLPSMIRLWNTAATGKRLGIGQIIPGDDSKLLRGRPVTASAYVRRGGAGFIYCSIIEYTGPKDNVDRNLVSDFANVTFQQNFMFKSTYNVLTTGSISLGAQTIGQISVTAPSVSSNANNLILWFHISGNEGPSNGHLDVAASLTTSNVAETYFEYRPYAIELGMCRRFYERRGGSANTQFPVYTESTTLALGVLNFDEKRVDTVNVTTSGDYMVRRAAGNSPVTALAFTDVSRKNALLQATTGATLTAGDGGVLKANTTASYIEIDAEI